jgi:hypothetical protein
LKNPDQDGAKMWLSGLIKNYALISLVEAQKNLDQMQKIKKQKKLEEKKQAEKKAHE